MFPKLGGLPKKTECPAGAHRQHVASTNKATAGRRPPTSVTGVFLSSDAYDKQKSSSKEARARTTTKAREQRRKAGRLSSP